MLFVLGFGTLYSPAWASPLAQLQFIEAQIQKGVCGGDTWARSPGEAGGGLERPDFIFQLYGEASLPDTLAPCSKGLRLQFPVRALT